MIAIIILFVYLLRRSNHTLVFETQFFIYLICF